jgi:hypothetical protein
MKGREMREQPGGGAVRTHTQFNVSCLLVWFVAPQNNYNFNVKEHQS